MRYRPRKENIRGEEWRFEWPTKQSGAHRRKHEARNEQVGKMYVKELDDWIVIELSTKRSS